MKRSAESQMVAEGTGQRLAALEASRRAKTDRIILTAAKGGGIVFAGKLFAYGARFVIGFILARLLGAEQFGLYNLALTAATMAGGFALLGLDSGLVRYVSLFAGRKDTAGLWGTIQMGLGFPTFMGIALAIGVYVLADPIAVRLFHEPQLIPLLRLTSIVVPFLALSNVAAAATRGFKNMHYTVIAQQVAQPVVRFLLILIVFATVGLDTDLAITIFIVGAAITCIVLLFFLNHQFSLKRPANTARHDTREIIKFSLPVYLTNLIQTFSSNIQTLLLSAFDTVVQVGILSVAGRVTMIGMMFYSAIVTASMPIVSELHDRGQQKQMEHIYQTMTKWAFTLNLPLFLVMVLFPQAILSLFGKGYVGGVTALVLLAWRGLVDTGTGICGVVIDMTGNTRLRLINTIVTVAITIGLNALLIPRYSLDGAAAAALVGIIIINSLRIAEVYILFRMLPYNKDSIKPVVAGLAALGTVLIANQLSPGDTRLILLTAKVILLSLVYIGMLLLLGLSQDDRLILTRLKVRLVALLARG